MQDDTKQRIESLIAAHGLSRAEFISRTGVLPARFEAAVNGRRRFALSDLALIAEAFGVSDEWLHHGKKPLPVLNAHA